MRLGYLGSDVQTEAQPSKASADLSPKKRLEEISHRCSGDWRACVSDPKLEHPVSGRGNHLDRLVRRAVGQSIAEQIGDHLANSRAVTVDRACYPEIRLYHPVRHRRAQF